MQEGQTPMPRPPLAVRVLDPIVRRLLGMGVPMGPNTLLTVRGRKSGEPRSAGVAVVEIGNRRWIVGAYGDVHWVRNLRAAGEGEILDRGRQRRFSAEEYGTVRAARWFRDVLVPHIHEMPLPRRLASAIFAREIIADPESAAVGHPVFELHLAA